MQGKIKVLIIMSFMMVLLFSIDVFAITGKGTQANPFVVSAEKGFKEALTEYTNKTSWIYIAVNGNIEITDTITVDYGKYRIYATGANRTIKRSIKKDAKVNKDTPKYCIKIMEGVQINFGYNASSNKLILDGSKASFNDQTRSSGWLRIGTGGICNIGINGKVNNVKNNNLDQSGAPITSWGDVIVNGEISNCQGINGGAIKSVYGTVTINDSASIYNCVSESEGGAIHLSGTSKLLMNGGQIYNCTAKQEGGAIFAKEKSQCQLLEGTIKNNKAGASAGGVFTGMGATLIVGKSAGTGPDISYNTAGGSGGGIRCNGGTSPTAGGITYIYGGNIYNNTSGRYGGGIACGKAGPSGSSKLIIKNTNIRNNKSVLDGGGIWTPDNAEGISNKNIVIDACRIENNVSEQLGGGMILCCAAEITNSRIVGNTAQKGGGIFIYKTGEFILKGAYISENKCSAQGSGIYVSGKFKILSDASVETNNIVYLEQNTYIDIIGKLNKNSGDIAAIDSQIKTNGTILIKADYAGTTATNELYYSGTPENEYIETKRVVKKYNYYNLPANRCLRPTEKVNGYDGVYIILSEKYTISYDKNTSEDVQKMPDNQIKFWEENIKISTNIVSKNGSGTDNAKHWNLNKDGTGSSIKPGSEYKLNENRILYAQWILWQVISKDRYYVVDQKITLDKNELLKKVMIENGNDISKYEFKVREIKNLTGSTMASGSDIVTNVYMNTLIPTHYTLKFEVRDDSNNLVMNEMKVYILDAPIVKGSVRFISFKYINTLQSDSRWYTSINNKLMESLRKKQGEGNSVINIPNTKMKTIKSKVKGNGYKITNYMNKMLVLDLQL